MKLYHLFAITPAADVRGLNQVQHHDFLVQAADLKGAYAMVEDFFFNTSPAAPSAYSKVSECPEVWGAQHFRDDVIVSPAMHLNLGMSYQSHLTWAGSSDYRLVHSGPVSLDEHFHLQRALRRPDIWGKPETLPGFGRTGLAGEIHRMAGAEA